MVDDSDMNKRSGKMIKSGVYVLKTIKRCVAGLDPSTLRGSKTGVYIGVSGGEAAEAFSRDPEELLGYSMTGCQRAMLANRLSYFFDFTGMQIVDIYIYILSVLLLCFLV